MSPLPSLLLAAAWLATVFALPHSEAVSTANLIARTEDPNHLPDLPTLAPASWCQEVPNGKGNVIWHTATGPCTYNTLRGEVTQIGTDWVQLPSTDGGLNQGERPDRPQPTGSPVVEELDGRCFFVKEKMNSASGKTYWGNSEDEIAQQTCNDYCATQLATDKPEGKIGSATCFKNDGKPWADDQGKQPSDESPVGTRIHGVGKCICDWPLMDDLVEDMVTKALPAIGEITCKTFYTTIDAVVMAGINAIPGFSAVGAAGVSVAAQAAEVMAWTFSDPNAALEHYGNWLQHPAGGDLQPSDGSEKPSTGLMDTICGNKYTPPDAEKIFNTFQLAVNFASAPKLFAGAAKSWPPPFEQGKGSVDEALDYIKGLGKGKGDGDKNKPEPTQPKPTDKPSTTAPHETTNTSQNSKCKRDGDCGVTSYIVNDMIAAEETVFTVTCDHQRYPQACANYYSAIRVGRPAAFTCTESHHPSRIDAQAVKDWKSQHKNEGWRSFTQAKVLNNKNEMVDTNCEVDEYPPSYFLDQEKTMAQVVRWIPKFDNGGAGQMWSGFCNSKDGNVGNGQRVGPAKDKAKNPIPEAERKLNEQLLKLEGGPEVKSKGGTTTSIWKKATYTKAVFSMAFSYTGDEVPSKENNWFLESNACWPRAVAPEDPGYALLTDDKWYDDHKDYPNAKYWRDRYTSDPAQDEIDAAKERQKGNKHSPPDSPDEQPPAQAPKTNPPPTRRGLGLEKLEFYEGRLIARDLETNATRPLTFEELRHEVEVVPCKDKNCSDELHGGNTNLVIPAVAPPSAPSVNRNAMPTFSPTQSIRTEVRPQIRTNVYPDLPVVTELVVLEA